MISYIKGILGEVGEGFVVIEAGGLGYFLSTPASGDYKKLKPGDMATFYTSFCLGEKNVELSGFLSREERDLFVAVKSISSFGSKLSMTILSSLTVKEFADAIVNEDKKILRSIPGLGDKKADRLALELRKNRVILALASLSAEAEEDRHGSVIFDENAENAAAALETFGCSGAEARKAVEKALAEHGPLAFEELFSKALEAIK